MLRNLQFPITEEKFHLKARQFQSLRCYPMHGIVVALDGLTIHIRKPRTDDVSDGKKYYNRKGLALLVQATVSEDYKFSFVSVKHAGSTNDSPAFQGTGLFDILKGCVAPPWTLVVGEDAYYNEGNTFKPYYGCKLSVAQD